MSVWLPRGIGGRRLAAPHASRRSAEGRGRLCGATICRTARLPGTRETLERSEKQQRLGLYTQIRHPDTAAAHSDVHTLYSSSSSSRSIKQRGTGKVWSNAVGVPAPHQPAVRLQQPARWPADGGLLLRAVAPARRLLQLRDRWVRGPARVRRVVPPRTSPVFLRFTHHLCRRQRTDPRSVDGLSLTRHWVESCFQRNLSILTTSKSMGTLWIPIQICAPELLLWLVYSSEDHYLLLWFPPECYYYQCSF